MEAGHIEAEGWKAKAASALRFMRDAAEETLWPTRCVGCGRPETLLCDECRLSLPWISQRDACPVCGAPYGATLCTECKGDWRVRTTICAMSFEGTAARLVRIYKDQHETRLARIMAAAIATALDEAEGCVLPDGEPRFDPDDIDAICFVPATPDALRMRGFDHMELVAKHLTYELGLPLADVLVKDSVKDQRDLGREARRENLEGTVEAIEDVSDMHLLLVDDVVTTGASIEASAEALLRRGARAVTAAAFARVW